MADEVLRLGDGRQDKLVMQMHGALLSAGSEQGWPLAVSDKEKRAVFDVCEPCLVKAQCPLTSMVYSFNCDRMALGQAQDALHPAQVAQRIVGREQFLYQLLDVRAKLLGLLFGVMDLEARDAEFLLGIMAIVGGEFADAGYSAMGREGLAVLAKDFHQLVGEPDSDLLTDVDKGNRVEVFLHLDMTIGMDFGAPPLA